jgi:hypothetical protein
LQDGKILLVGGDNENGMVGSAEIFDPTAMTSSNTGSNPLSLRTDHSATLLSDGRVLIVGGVDSNGLLSSTEFYNPYSLPAPSFSAGPSLLRARSGHTATVLADGKILIGGGEATGSAEIFDPASQNISLVGGALNTPRQYHSAALLNDGRVLILGGVVGANTVLTSAELYDPQTQMFTPASGMMQTPRGLALLRVLPDGKVQVIGGDGEFSMEMFDAATNSFIALAHIPPHQDYLDNLITSRTRSALITTIIQQNPVLQGQPELTAEFIALLNRLDHTVTEIPQSNRALIAGGVNDAGQILGSATIVSSSAATVTTDRFDYAPGEIVTITGAGWQPNETVWMLLHEEPETRDDTILSSVADSQGNFISTEFAPLTVDAYRTFTLTAIGQTSGLTTQTAFKDAPRIASVNVGSQTGTLTYGTAGSATFTITVNRGSGPGSAGAFNAALSVTTALPAGMTASFSPNPIAFAAAESSKTSTLTIITTAATLANSPAGTGFTVRAALTTGGGADNASGNGTVTVQKATPIINWSNPADITYGTALSATQLNATATHNGNSVAGTFTYNPASGTVLNAGNNQNLHVDFTPSDTANYNNASKDVKINVLKASSTTTVTCPASVVYNGSAQTPCTVSVTGAGGLNLTPAANYSNNINVGTATASYTFAETPNHLGSSDSKNFLINKAPVTATAGSGSATYDGATKSPSACVVSGVYTGDLSCANNPASVGPGAGTTTIVPVVSGTGLSNFDITLVNGSYTINKAPSITVVTCPASVVYNGSAQTPCTVSVTGAGGLNLTPAANYSNNINVGTATASYMFAETPNHLGSSDSKTFLINKAPVTATAGSGSATYDGSTKSPPACMVTGAYTGDLTCANSPASVGPDAGTTTIIPVVSGTGLSNFDITLVNGSYTIEKAASTTTVTCPASAVYNGFAQTPCSVLVTGAGGLSLTPAADYSNNVNAGTATASYTFAEMPNHLGSSDSKNFTIEKAATLTTVTCGAGPFTFNGNPHTPCSATVTGPGGLNQALTVNYTDNVNAGTATASASYAETANYKGSSDSKNFTIEKAATVTTVSCGAGPFIFNGSPHTPCTASVSGPGGLNQALTVNYTDNVNAGTATASASYAETANYKGSSDSKNFAIDRAPSMTTVTFEAGPYTYRGSAFTATGVVTGAGGLNHGVAVVYSGDCLNVTTANGCTATATFVGDTNHTGSSDSKSITLVKADATIHVYGYSGAYNGAPHGASGTATGVQGENLSASLNLGNSYTYVPGGTANWTFTDVTGNYNNKSGSVDIVITTAFAYDGFYSPIGGYGGSYANTVRTFKLGSTIPVKFSGTWLNSGAPLITGIHTLQAVKYSNATDADPPIDATPTDAATTGNQFRLTDGQWHFNLSTKGNGFSAGTWLLTATLQDGSKHSVWITLKK